MKRNACNSLNKIICFFYLFVIVLNPATPVWSYITWKSSASTSFAFSDVQPENQQNIDNDFGTMVDNSINFYSLEREIRLFCEFAHSLIPHNMNNQQVDIHTSSKQAIHILVQLRETMHSNRAQLYERETKSVYKKIFEALDDIEFLMSLSLIDYYSERCSKLINEIRDDYLMLLCKKYQGEKRLISSDLEKTARHIIALCFTDLYRWFDHSLSEILNFDVIYQTRDSFYHWLKTRIQLELEREEEHTYYYSVSIRDNVNMAELPLAGHLTITDTGQVKNLSIKRVREIDKNLGTEVREDLLSLQNDDRVFQE